MPLCRIVCDLRNIESTMKIHIYICIMFISVGKKVCKCIIKYVILRCMEDTSPQLLQDACSLEGNDFSVAFP